MMQKEVGKIKFYNLLLSVYYNKNSGCFLIVHDSIKKLILKLSYI